MEDKKDERLWRIARKRAAFRHNLNSYIVVNIFLWIIWWYTQNRWGHDDGWPWPLWVMIFWGLGLMFNYMDAYRGDKESMAEKEYEKLKKQEENK